MGESVIENQPVVQLLGPHVDSLLGFNVHIDDIICRSGRKKIKRFSEAF